MPNYLLLVRHATRDRDWLVSEPDQLMKDWRELSNSAADSSKTGLPLTLALTSALRDELRIRNIKVVNIIYSQHKIARQTAEVFADILEVTVQSEDQHLSPETMNDRAVVQKLEKAAARMAQNAAWVVIGHQPQLTRIARHLLDNSQREFGLKRQVLKVYNRFWKNPLPANTLPLGNSEIACLELGDQARLLWLLTEKSPDLLTELKTKIGSKYEVAKFFLGTLVVGTGITLSEKFWALPDPIDKTLAGLGAFSALVSLGLTAATLFSYDRLQMPREFWGEGGADKGALLDARPPLPTPKPWSVTRPPSQIHVVLFYEMVHIWNRLFIPAICCAFAALGFLMMALAHNGIPWLSPKLRLALVFGLAVLAFSVGMVAFRRWKPRLGFDD